MTLMALVVAVTAGAQGTTIHEYPWNPDSNNDNLIGVDDLLDFLPSLEMSLVIRLSLVIMMGRRWRSYGRHSNGDIILTQFLLSMSLKMSQLITPWLSRSSDGHVNFAKSMF